MSEIDRATLKSLGLALCDELSGVRVGWRGHITEATGAYEGDTFLDGIATYLAPDVFEPDNEVTDAALSERLRTVGGYLEGLASRGALDADAIAIIMAAVDLSPLDVPNAAPSASTGIYLEAQGQQALFPVNRLPAL